MLHDTLIIKMCLQTSCLWSGSSGTDVYNQLSVFNRLLVFSSDEFSFLHHGWAKKILLYYTAKSRFCKFSVQSWKFYHACFFMVKYRWVRMGTEKKRFLYQPSGSADKKTFDYASSAGCIAPDSWAAPATRAAGGESSVRQVRQVRSRKALWRSAGF